MATPLRVVILEDDPSEAERLVSELQRASFAPVWQRVETQAAFLAHLDSSPDLILTNFALQQLGGMTSLELMRERGLDVPFIIVADAIEAELAVAAVKAGADDYLARDRLHQLGDTVNRALSRRRLRAVQRRSEFAYRFLHEAGRVLTSSLDYRATINALADLVVPAIADQCVVVVQDDDRAIRWLTTSPERSLETPVPADLVRVVQSGVPELRRQRVLDDAVKTEDDAEALPFGEVRMPLLARGRVIGAICFSTKEPSRRFDLLDLGLLEEIGRLAALTIDNGRLHQEVRDALATRDQFLSIATHELRTPVTQILGFAELLKNSIQRGSTDSALQARHLQRIVEGSNHLTRLAHDLLDARYLDEGELPFRFAMVDLVALVHAVTDRQRDQLGTCNQVLIEEPPTPYWIYADRDRIEQVLTNLLTNAVKFSPDGGDIRVIIAPSRAGVRLTVQDVGIGLPTGSTATIFTPFARAANARDRSVPGLGLGLSISRTIVGRHQGQIWAESAGEGLGTAVSVWLPVIDQRSAESPEPLSPVTMRSPRTGHPGLGQLPLSLPSIP